MPAPKTLPYNAPFPMLRRHLTYTRRELQAHPVTMALAAPYGPLLTKWGTILEADFDLQDQVDEALSSQRAIDIDLNRIARRLWKEIGLVTGTDGDSLLRQLYFGSKSAHVFIRPILAGQLAAMRAWVQPLANSEHPTLQAIGADLAPLVPQADAAVAAGGNAQKKLDEFRKVGARKAFVDEVNTQRKETYNAALKVQQSHPELTSDVIEGLFRRGRSRPDEPTIEAVEEEIQEIEALLTDKQKLLAKLQKEKEQADAEQKQTEIEQKKQKLAQLQKELEDKQKEASDLAAELGDA